METKENMKKMGFPLNQQVNASVQDLLSVYIICMALEVRSPFQHCGRLRQRSRWLSQFSMAAGLEKLYTHNCAHSIIAVYEVVWTQI